MSTSSSDGRVGDGMTSGAATAGDASGTGGGGGDADGGLTGGSMKDSLFVDFFFCMAGSLIRNFLLRQVEALMELVLLRNSGVSATSLSGTL